MKNSAFLLFRLPKNVQLHLLRCFEYSELFTFSLLTNRTKRLVVGLKSLPRSEINVEIGRNLIIRIPTKRQRHTCLQFVFYDENESEDALNVDVTLPKPPQIQEYQLGRPIVHCGYVKVATGREMTLNDWMTHFLTIFWKSKPRFLCISFGAERFDMQSVYNMFKHSISIRILTDASSLLATRVIEKFKNTNRLDLFHIPYTTEDVMSRQKLFMSNFQYLVIMLGSLSLDDLLMINSKNFAIQRTNFCAKDMNRFFKHWILGSNPRMIWMAIQSFSGPVNSRELLRGLTYSEVPGTGPAGVRYEIRRRDHAVGSIYVESLPLRFVLTFSVKML
ncbi:hypothetical protein GCK72_011309 [Caenorhabditis remanei]|uniref:F-box domain-containing protein n=1 Tax=Caenorhabditis remanei TaxID=31234 RepID=A0A6A5H8B9_CAERE|nr:hypothetical protein GCK72_011309 [Caenorhabditis remanei]KAF1763044.1 hypothetical protein GCK72_011309 [Caenorhabditis remanei]